MKANSCSKWNINWDLYFLICILFGFLFHILFSFVLPNTNSVNLYDGKRFFVMMMLGLAWLSLCHYHNVCALKRAWQSLESITQYLLIFLFLGVCVSLFYAQYPITAITQTLYFFGLVLLVFLVSRFFYQQTKWFYRFIYLTSIVLIFDVTFPFWARVYLDMEVNKFTILNFSNPRFLNQIHVWLIFPLVYFTFLNIKRKRYPKLSVFFLTLNMALCFALDARGLVLSILVGFAFLFCLDHSYRQLWLKIAVVSLCGGWLCSFIFYSPLPSFLFSDQMNGLIFPELRTTSSGRMDLWKQAWEMRSLFGKGTAAFVCSSAPFGRPHNSVLSVLVSWGWITTFVYLSLVVILIKNTVMAQRRSVRLYGIGIFTGWFYSLFSGVIDSPFSQLMAVICLSFFWLKLVNKNKRSFVLENGEKSQRSVNKYYLIARSQHALIFFFTLIPIFSLQFQLSERMGVYSTKLIEVKDSKTQFWIGFNCLELNETVGMGYLGDKK
ncbi:O-antigen ligase family protein [Vibrio navarrensis]|uniref:O-antigen ligase family protein n=1 Tax=Vibrio navarrensis TaxID=29495 RepID=UPI0018698A96|nr:O-antigen ligase family protein [Vibrio navarrensis]MBE4579470.1 hypothetical protein [Vibrio navarrensis]